MTSWREIAGDWDRILHDIVSDPKMIAVLNLINSYYKGDTVIYPRQEDVFKAFKECPYSKLSVVIILQDPYHDGSATGIAMGNEPGTRMSPSLRIVKDTVSRTIYNREEFDFDPTLVSWSKQGVLLLNTALTVERGRPLSHQKLWSYFTERLLIKLSDMNSGVIYCLWGRHAESFRLYINPNSNTILSSAHPVSAAYQGIPWECDHFIKINRQLKDFNNLTIKW